MNQTLSNTDQSDQVWRDLVAASKKKKGPLYTRYVNRNAAIPLTWLLWRLGLHPNAVSLISFAVTHSAFVMLITLGISPAVCVAAWLVLVLGYMLDSCDGQLARVSGRTSKLGEWLDHTLDMVKLLNFHMLLGYLMIIHGVPAGLSLTLVFVSIFLNLLSQPAHFFVINMKDQLLGHDAPSLSASSGGGPALLLARFILNAADYGLFILIVLLLPWPEIFIWVYLLHGIFFFLLFIAHFVRVSRIISRA